MIWLKILGMRACTITTKEIGKYWIIHEALFEYLKIAVNSDLFFVGNDRIREALHYC